MASLANQTISSSYDGLIKTATDNAVGVSGVQLLEDGSGNSLALSVGRANNGVTITGNLAVDTNTLYVDAANNWVGIGKTSRLDTQTKFQISSGDSGVTSFSSFGDDVIIEHSTNVGLTFATPNDGFASILFADPEVSGAGSILYDHSGDNLRISTNNAEAMRIDSSGNVGIGTSSPTAPLQVERNSSGWTTYIKNTSATSPSGLLLSGGDSSANFAMYVRNAAETSDLFAIKGNGNVGIGTSSPTFNLEVENSSGQAILGITAKDGNYSTLLFGDVSNNYVNQIRTDHSANALTFHTATTTLGGNERMRIDSSGRVFIGTTSAFDANAITMSDNGQVFANNFAIANAAGSVGGTSPNLYSPASATLAISTGGSERMRIDSLGRVGIGESVPLVPLHISKNTASGENIALILDNNNTTANNEIGLLFRGSVGGQNTDFQISSINTAANAADLVFRSDGATERMRIDSSGNVGIGTSNPDTLMHIRGTAATLTLGDSTQSSSSVSTILFKNSDGNGANREIVKIKGLTGANGGYGNIVFETAFNNTLSERMRITSGGDVLIGTTGSPDGTTNYGAGFITQSNERKQLRLASNTTGGLDLAQFYNPNGKVGSILTNGSATSFVTSSDYRLKENVVEMTGALDRVDALKPSRFNFIGEDKTVDGFLAHEVQAIVPEAVTGEKDAVDEEGNPIYQGIDQSKITPLLTAAIKELKALIEAQQAEIETLKSQING